jgi:hypothetical protein
MLGRWHWNTVSTDTVMVVFVAVPEAMVLFSL